MDTGDIDGVVAMFTPDGVVKDVTGKRPPSFPKLAVPRPLPRRTRATAPAPLLRGLSRPCAAALRLAARRSSGLPHPQRVVGEGGPPARGARGVA
jgi:hypothetical protein